MQFLYLIAQTVPNFNSLENLLSPIEIYKTVGKNHKMRVGYPQCG